MGKTEKVMGFLLVKMTNETRQSTNERYETKVRTNETKQEHGELIKYLNQL